MRGLLNSKGKIFALAPMAGFTNSPCRKIFREFGADIVVSEFVYSRAVLSGSGRVLDKLAMSLYERPAGIQIFGSNPAEMAEAACKIEEELSPDFIDINFGCPAPSAVGAGAGAALLRDIPLMAKIVKSVSESLKRTPCTAKMRTGWSSSEIVLPYAALALQDAGVKMLTIHGRTKAQGYSGDSDWALIESCAEKLDIPVLGNGSAEKLSANQMRSSVCSGFMIGRAALGNPWIFKILRARLMGEDELECNPTPAERAALAIRYAELVCAADFKMVSENNLTYVKTQIMPFLKNASGFKKFRVALMRVNTLDELKNLLCEYL